jgi:L-asparaginase II
MHPGAGMTNPVLVHVMRGGIVESRHRGVVCRGGPGRRHRPAVGDIAQPVFPRSAIKSFQALPMVEMAAERFGFTDRDRAGLRVAQR